MEPIRTPCVAGQFYEANPSRCLAQLEACVNEARRAPVREGPFLGGVVPHAGWVFSGPTAARVFLSIARSQVASTFVLLGADHRGQAPRPAIYDRGSWQTPLGLAPIDEALAAHLVAELADLAIAAPQAHRMEHSLEVQVPFIQHLFPKAKIVPITVPPDDEAAAFGVRLAQALSQSGEEVVVLGSSDLTHYGPNYGFMPHGLGEEALDWVKSVNDRRILDLAVGLSAEQVVGEADASRSACGAGAIAATTAYCRARGADRGMLLHYTTSHDVMPERRMSSFVGYAAIVFGKGR
jgi:AmmeMemoRadiSam system protein B